MLSYICDFNLRVSGEEAEKYLTRIVREWPALYAELPGVQGTLLLANAFALAGEYTYQWRVDFESLKTLRVIDEALKSDDPKWREARAEWFDRRAGVRARLLRQDSGSPGLYTKSDGGKDGLVHFVLSYGSGGVSQLTSSLSLFQWIPTVWRSLSGVRALQHLTVVIQPFSGGKHEIWARLGDLSALEEIRLANDFYLLQVLRANDFTTHLYGELREVEGALLVGA